MVEYELPIIVTMVSQIATALGVCIAAYYYVMTLRNTEKIRRRDMVFQKLNVNNYIFYDIFFDVAKMVDWATLQEFEKKYHYWVNPEAWKKFMYIMNHYNCLGILVQDGVVDVNQVFQLYSAGFYIRFYGTFKPWIDIQGINDEYFAGVNFLYAEARRLYPEVEEGRLVGSVEEWVELSKSREKMIK